MCHRTYCQTAYSPKPILPNHRSNAVCSTNAVEAIDLAVVSGSNFRIASFRSAANAARFRSSTYCPATWPTACNTNAITLTCTNMCLVFSISCTEVANPLIARANPLRSLSLPSFAICKNRARNTANSYRKFNNSLSSWIIRNTSGLNSGSIKYINGGYRCTVTSGLSSCHLQCPIPGWFVPHPAGFLHGLPVADLAPHFGSMSTTIPSPPAPVNPFSTFLIALISPPTTLPATLLYLT